MVKLGIFKKLREEDRILRVSQRNLNAIFEKNPDAMIVVNNAGVVCFINPAAKFLFDLKKDKLLSLPFGIPAINDEAIEINMVGKEGKNNILQIRTVNIEWDKKPSRLILIQDITLFKEAERLKYEINERRALDELKDEFISTVSHELRTPLATMREFTSIMLDEVSGKINEKQKEYLNIIKNNLERLFRIVTDLLDISKIEAKKILIKKNPVDIVGLAKETVAMFRANAGAKNIALTTVFPQHLPDVHADADRVVQIFTNLINNAIKFTPPNGKISVEIKAGEKEIICSVNDTGIGISAVNKDKLFNRFVQIGRTAGGGPKGTGLGLSITRGLVQMYGGKIWAESEFGKGSKFIFTLPILNSEDIFEEYINSGIKQAQAKGSKFSLIVITLDDSQEVLEKLDSKTSYEILMDLEEISKKTLRRVTDIVLRNKEEVIILLPDVKKEDVLAVQRRFEGVLAAYTYEKKDSLPRLRINFGIATFPDEARDTEELVNKARQRREVTY